MSYLLDTCILSELRKKIPPQVAKWFETKDQDLFYISVVTLAELCDGIERLPNSEKKRDLEDWFYGEVHTHFKNRILSIDDHIAKEWGRLNADLQRRGITIGTQDLYIAATAKAAGFSIVTINLKDFESMGLPLHNPWKEKGAW